jgi:pyridoxal biosynthesis lyase PdxS
MALERVPADIARQRRRADEQMDMIDTIGPGVSIPVMARPGSVRFV